VAPRCMLECFQLLLQTPRRFQFSQFIQVEPSSTAFAPLLTRNLQRVLPSLALQECASVLADASGVWRIGNPDVLVLLELAQGHLLKIFERRGPATGGAYSLALAAACACSHALPDGQAWPSGAAPCLGLPSIRTPHAAHGACAGPQPFAAVVKALWAYASMETVPSRELGRHFAVAIASECTERPHTVSNAGIVSACWAFGNVCKVLNHEQPSNSAKRSVLEKQGNNWDMFAAPVLHAAQPRLVVAVGDSSQYAPSVRVMCHKPPLATCRACSAALSAPLSLPFCTDCRQARTCNSGHVHNFVQACAAFACASPRPCASTGNLRSRTPPHAVQVISTVLGAHRLCQRTPSENLWAAVLRRLLAADLHSWKPQHLASTANSLAHLQELPNENRPEVAGAISRLCAAGIQATEVR
jgi:hypothetical protein